MSLSEHTPEFTLLEEAITILFCLKRLGFSQKTECGGAGTRRVAQSGLESEGCPTPRCSAIGVCG